MTRLFFDETKWHIYKAIEWAAENSSDEEVRQVCSMALAEGTPSAFGYTLQVNEYWASKIIQAQAEFLKMVQDTTGIYL